MPYWPRPLNGPLASVRSGDAGWGQLNNGSPGRSWPAKVIFHGKRDFVDVTNLEILRWGAFSGLAEVESQTSVLVEGRKRVKVMGGMGMLGLKHQVG